MAKLQLGQGSPAFNSKADFASPSQRRSYLGIYTTLSCPRSQGCPGHGMRCSRGMGFHATKLSLHRPWRAGLGWAAQEFGEPGPLPNLSPPCSVLSPGELQPVLGSALSTAQVHMESRQQPPCDHEPGPETGPDSHQQAGSPREESSFCLSFSTLGP